MSSQEFADIAWFLSRDGHQHGPVTDAEFRQIIKSRHLLPTDWVWRDGFTDWVEAGSLPELRAVFQSHPPPPPARPTPAPWPVNNTGPFDSQAAAGSAATLAAPASAAQSAGYQPSSGANGETSTSLPLAAYILLLLPIPPLPLLGLIIALVNTDAKPDWAATHYRWQWRTAAKGFVMYVIGFLTLAVGIGALIILAVIVWTLVRHIKGISALNRREGIENYRTWLW